MGCTRGEGAAQEGRAARRVLRVSPASPAHGACVALGVMQLRLSVVGGGMACVGWGCCCCAVRVHDELRLSQREDELVPRRGRTNALGA